MSKTPLFHWMGKMVRQAIVAQHQLQAPESETSAALERTLSRRDFLKIMAGAVGTVAAVQAASVMPPHLAYAASAPLSPKEVSKSAASEPILIVGGGLAGLVTAYRLMQQQVPCEIYEAGRRLGGRIFTQYDFNRDGMFVELGGELVDTGHEDLIALCAELNVPLEHFEIGEQNIEAALYFSQGKIRSEAEALEAFKPLAAILARDIAKCFPDGEIHMPTYQQPYNAKWLDAMNLADYLDAQKQVAPWLIQLVKAAYTGEYGLDPHEQSALNLLLLIGTETSGGLRMFGESDEAMRIKGGNSRIIQALTTAIQDRVPIHTGHCLSHIQHVHDQIQMTFQAGQVTREVKSERVVLAIPFSVLRHVDGIDHLGLSALKRKSIGQWGYGTNSKQMIGFVSRFWRNPKSLQPDTSVPANSGELFTDWASQCYWETSRLQTGQAGILTNFLGGQAGRDATRIQWKNALKDLQTLYPRANQELDDQQAFFNWFYNPFAKGSYTCPKPGQYTTLMGVAQEPELKGRLFFAGEHCSVDWAGFMNGAAQSGNVAARQISTELQIQDRQAQSRMLSTV